MQNEKSKDRVLFVDDEESVLRSIRRGLVEEPYEKIFARNGQEALAILKSNLISVIVTDLKMPGMNGMELLGIVKVRCPDVIRVIVTGAADIATVLSAIHKGETHRYLKKPVHLEEELIPTIRQSIELHNLRREKQIMVLKIFEYNQELEKKNKELQESQQQLLEKKKLEAALEMAITISHEFSQPLSVISGYLGILLDIVDDKLSYYSMIKKTSDSVMELTDIIRKVQSISQYKTATYVDHLKMVDIHDSESDEKY